MLRSQQEAMVYPHLWVGENYSGQGFAYNVNNSGTGLAIIENYSIRMDGSEYSDWLEIVNAVMPEGHSIDYGIVRSTNITNQVLTPNQEETLFGIRWNDETRQLVDRVGEIEITICYRSLLGQSWVVSNTTEVPKEIANCNLIGQ